MIGTWTLQEIAHQLKVSLPESVEGTTRVKGISTDTRRLNSGDVLVCLSGENFDAHDYLEEAKQQGAIAAITAKPVASELTQMRVDDPLWALGVLGAENRRRFQGKVVGITGSAGKTTVKEILASMLSSQAKTCYTQGNLNNHIGVPLTLLNIDSEHAFAVIEMGASAEKEIHYTAHLALPQIAILTNAAAAHLEGFGSLEGVARGKSEIFEPLTFQGTAIINIDDYYADFWLEKVQQIGCKVMTFALNNPKADLYVDQAEEQSNGTWRFRLHHHDAWVEISLPLLGKHNINNALAASAAWVALGLSLPALATAMQTCVGMSGRMMPYQIGAALIIDDSYNANPDAMKAAIDYLKDRPGKRLLVLGDMGELGELSKASHAEIGTYAAAAKIDYLYAIGPLMQYTIEASQNAGLSSEHFSDQNTLINALRPRLDEEVTVLIKGSRSARMDIIVDALKQGSVR